MNTYYKIKSNLFLRINILNMINSTKKREVFNFFLKIKYLLQLLINRYLKKRIGSSNSSGELLL